MYIFYDQIIALLVS